MLAQGGGRGPGFGGAMLTASCLKHVPTNAVKDVVMVAKDAASHRWAWEA